MGEVRRFLCGSPGEEYKGKMVRRYFDYAWQAYRVLRYILLLFSCGILVFILSPGDNFSGNIEKKLYFAFYAVLAGITILFIALDLLWLKRQWKKEHLYLSLGFINAICIVLWGSCITVLDYMRGQGVTVYIYTMLTCAVTIILKPWQSITIFFGSCLFSNIIIGYRGQEIHPYFNQYVIDMFFFAGIASVISIFFYISRMRNNLDQMIIEEQNLRLKSMNERLKKEIIIDSLTGLYNRRFLSDVIGAKFEECAVLQMYVACMMVDIDYFKQFNDHYGHQRGDECLVEVADIIKKCFVREEERAVRYGGEEFLIFLMGCREEKANSMAEKLRKEIMGSELSRCDVSNGQVTVSIGVYAEKLNEKSQLKSMIQCADDALYRAKEDGRNCVRVFCKGS